MNRRQVLTGLAGLGLTGGSAWALRNDFSSGSSGLPVRVETIDAQGSESGGVRVPVAESPTLVDLFATWCAPCEKQMAALGAVHGGYADRVRFVSVTNERVGGTLSRDDLRAWWREHDGAWTVGLDPESDLMSALGADGLPYLALVDATGEIRWTHGGVSSASTLRDHLDAVLAES